MLSLPVAGSKELTGEVERMLVDQQAFVLVGGFSLSACSYLVPVELSRHHISYPVILISYIYILMTIYIYCISI